MDKSKLKASFLSPYKIVKQYFNNQSPCTIEVHPSYACNYNCQWCIDKELSRNGDNKDFRSMMSEEIVREIIRFSIERHVPGIIISGGGEPTLNKNTELLAKLARENNIQIGLFTNGSNLNDRNIKTYLDNLWWMRFSFDDFDPENYAKTKGTTEKMYYKVLDNIKKVMEYKRKTNNTTCNIGIDFVLMPSNINKMWDIYEKSKELGVNYLQFCDCIIVGYEFTQLRKDMIDKNLEKIYEANNYNRDGLEVVYEPLQQENRVMCRDCELTSFLVQVGADGVVRPCAHCARRDYLAYGDLNKQSFSEIWDNRPDPLDTDYLFENCRYRQQNAIVKGLKNITHGDMV